MPLLAVTLVPDASLSSLALLAMLAGFLALDDVALGQTWFSQPLPAALLCGFFCGDPLTGLAIGVPLQLILVVNLPIGQSFTGDPAPAVVAAVGATVISGQSLTRALTQAAPAEFGFTGWMILAAGLLSAAGHFLIQAERRAHVLWMLEGHKTLRDGNLGRMVRLQARCLTGTFFRGGIFAILFLLLLLKIWIPLYDLLPARLHHTLAILPWLLPGLGLGTLIDRYGTGKAWVWVLAGFILALGVSKLGMGS
ncbi:MAG: PTS sugar transporter subunit IIC [bacterium]|nr:PTS sugar transporter subunit IIC [bacterium]